MNEQIYETVGILVVVMIVKTAVDMAVMVFASIILLGWLVSNLTRF